MDYLNKYNKKIASEIQRQHMKHWAQYYFEAL